jgi:hypothetical protein
VEMAVKSMEMAVEATVSMEMALGALPHPGRVPEQRLTDRFRVFRRMALYRQRGGIRGGLAPPHHRAARARGVTP